MPQDMSIDATATIDITATKDEEAGENGSDQGRSPDKPGPALARFRMTANTGAPMRLAGWKHPVILDLDGVTIPAQKAPVRFNHDAHHGVGHTESIGVEGGRLVASGVISRTTPAAVDVTASAKNGFPWQASVGATADEVEFVKAGQKVVVNGQQTEGPVNIARKSTLGEISFVDLGADPHTDALIATPAVHSGRIAAAKDEDDDDTVRPRDGQEAIEQAIFRREKELTRQKGIAALVDEALAFRGANTDQIKAVAKKALEENWDVRETELALLRANRAKVPDLWMSENDAPSGPEVMEAALLLHLGIDGNWLCKPATYDVSKMDAMGQSFTYKALGGDYRSNVVEEANKFRNRGLRGMIAAAMESVGIRAPHGGREFYDAIITNTHNGRLTAAGASGFSTVNLPGILGNIANKILLEAFTKIDATYDKVADQADFSNFHIHSIYRLGVTGDFAQIKPDGEIPHGTLEQDGNYTNQLATFGRMLTLNRQDIINDDLNAFRSLTAQLARRARIAAEKALYLLVCEASNVFYTPPPVPPGKGNLLTSNALSIVALAAAEAAQYAMTDVNGDPIYAISRFLLVPPQLKFLAEMIYTSRLVNDFSGGPKPTDNPFVNRFIPVSSPYLSNPGIPGNSPTSWYLLADPLMLPAFQIAYLDGRRAPTIESADALFNVLGLQLRAYWDFGVAQLDYRGAIKCTA